MTRSELGINQWRIPDFPEEGAPTPKSAIILPFFCQKLHGNERIWTRGGGRVARVPDAPLRSANGFDTQQLLFFFTTKALVEIKSSPISEFMNKILDKLLKMLLLTICIQVNKI